MPTALLPQGALLISYSLLWQLFCFLSVWLNRPKRKLTRSFTPSHAKETMALVLTEGRRWIPLELSMVRRMRAGHSAPETSTDCVRPLALPGNTLLCTTLTAHSMATDQLSVLWPSTTARCLEPPKAADIWVQPSKSGYLEQVGGRVSSTALAMEKTVSNPLAE